MEVAKWEHLLYLVPLFSPFCRLLSISPCSPASFVGFGSSESPEVNSGEEGRREAPQGVGLLLASGVPWRMELFNSYSVLVWERGKDGVCPESSLFVSLLKYPLIDCPGRAHLPVGQGM